jgi:hypothetical protein
MEGALSVTNLEVEEAVMVSSVRYSFQGSGDKRKKQRKGER